MRNTGWSSTTMIRSGSVSLGHVVTTDGVRSSTRVCRRPAAGATVSVAPIASARSRIDCSPTPDSTSVGMPTPSSVTVSTSAPSAAASQLDPARRGIRVADDVAHRLDRDPVERSRQASPAARSAARRSPARRRDRPAGGVRPARRAPPADPPRAARAARARGPGCGRPRCGHRARPTIWSSSAPAAAGSVVIRLRAAISP